MSLKEIWKPIPAEFGKEVTQRYAISNHGRAASYKDSNLKDLYILKPNDNHGFHQINIRHKGKNKSILFHRAVAAAFMKKPSPKHTMILHLDYNKKNNHTSNLKWATKTEHNKYVQNSPLVKLAREKRVVVGLFSRSLNEAKVRKMKEMIWNPKRKKTLAQIAAQFGVSEMNVYRIKSGEFWYHIHVEGEPIHPKYKTYLKNLEYHKKKDEKAQKALAKKTATKKTSAKKAVTSKKVTKKGKTKK